MNGEHGVLQDALRRAERDARRWEAAAQESERQRNAALERERDARAEAEAAKRRYEQAAELLVEGLDELAARVASAAGIGLPSRGCPEDDF